MSFNPLVRYGFDRQGEGITQVSPDTLSDSFTETVPLGDGTQIDWAEGVRFTKTMTENTVFTFTNVYVGSIFLELTGDFAATLPEGFVFVGGERSASGVTYVQIVCLETETPGGIYALYKDESA